tara:strand:+ start:641 stop:946 length:306 start_codon:yes stop_codon:yes gene_type:complete
LLDVNVSPCGIYISTIDDEGHLSINVGTVVPTEAFAAVADVFSYNFKYTVSVELALLSNFTEINFGAVFENTFAIRVAFAVVSLKIKVPSGLLTVFRISDI